MKRISYLLIIVFCSSIILSSCNDTTYAKELQNEQTLIDNFINRSNINVLSSFPANNVWGENDYVLTKSGLYFHLVSPGAGTDTLTLSNTVTPRYIQYTLDENPEIISDWTTVDLANPVPFVYGENMKVCAAFHEAASYMKRNDSRAIIIVPSKIGFFNYYSGLIGNKSDGTFDYLSTVTPLKYDFKIKFQK